MATIALYAGKMNHMSSLLGEVIKSVDDYSSELFSLKSKALNIRKSVCDLDDVIRMVQASTEIQEKKIESLENLNQKTEEFTAEVVRIDEEVAAVIDQSKENFYNKYNYLKPDAEKNFLEMCFDNAAEWCVEHWQEIATTVAIVIGAVLAIEAVIVTGGAALVPLLTTVLGVSAGTASTISFTVATIAVASTIGASVLNIADTWGNIDNPTFNTWQSALNWTSTISNGLYSIGMLYNSIKYKSDRSFNWESKEAGGAETLKNIKYSPVNPCDKISQEVAESFRSATFTEKVLTEDTIMYRVSGGKAGKVGSYLSKTSQGGGLQSQLDLALNPSWGNTTENVTKVIVPKGTVIYEGAAAPQNILDSLGNTIGTLPGGGNQIYIPKVEVRWFK